MPTRSHRRVLVLGFAAVLIGSITAAAVWSDTDDRAATPRTPRAQVLAGVCASADAADNHELRQANGLFLSRAHTGLHEVAADLQDVDRRLAARLLEAKNRVEVSLPSRADSAAGDLRTLVRLTATGIGTLDGTPPPTCTKDPANP